MYQSHDQRSITNPGLPECFFLDRSLTWEVSDDVFHCNQWGRPAGPPFGSNFVSISLGSGAPWKFALGPQQFDKARIQKAIGDLVSK